MRIQSLNPLYFHQCVGVIRKFFTSRGFIEVQTTENILDCLQSKDSRWSESQIWLENILLDNLSANGYFALTNNKLTTFDTNEQNSVFEFVSKGNMENLISINKDLLQSIGFKHNQQDQQDQHSARSQYMYLHPFTHGIMGEYGQLIDWGRYKNYDEKYPDYSKIDDRSCDSCDLSSKTEYRTHYPEYNYDEIIKKLNIDEKLCDYDEKLANHDESVVFLKNFPKNISSCWSIKTSDNIQKQVDIILHGNKTIQSVEKSCDKDMMKHLFHNILNEDYLKYDKVDKNRINEKFDEFIEKDFFPRYTGIIDINNMSNAMIMSNLMDI